MSTIRSERVADRLVIVPASSTRLNSYRALDAGRAMTDLTSNTAHLCEESVRPLFSAVGPTITQLQANDLAGFTADVARDYPPPSATDVTHAWEEIAWTRNSCRRFGPFSISPDNGDRPTNGTPRKVRVVLQLDVPVSTRSKACAVMTATSSAEDIRTGRYLDAAEVTYGGTGVTTSRFDLDPQRLIDGAYPYNRTVPCSPSGATDTQLRTFYLWVGWSIWAYVPTTFDVLSISAFEMR